MTTTSLLAVPILAVSLASSLAAAPAHAQADASRPQPAAAEAPSKPAQASATGDARRVVRDPVTGRLRAPTADEVSADNARTGNAGPGAPLSTRVHANGMKSAVLGPDYMVTLKAERGPDGRLVVKHDNPRDEHAQAGKPTAAKASHGAATE